MIPQVMQPRLNLEGTTERAKGLDDGRIQVENIAYDADGKELVIAVRVETKEGLEKKKALYLDGIAKIEKILEQVN